MTVSAEQIRKAEAKGLINVAGLAAACNKLGFPFYMACTILSKETGGRNIYGHDVGGIFTTSGNVTVTETNYKEFLRRLANGERSNGVGPMQLCVAPGTRVLTADLRWLPAEKVAAGTEVVAFDEEGTWDEYHPIAKRRYFRTALVEDMWVDVMERVLVRTERREILVTPNHKFLTWRPARYTWREAAKLKPGDTLPSTPVWDEEDSYIAGYLAGQFDGEGCLTLGRLANGKTYSRLLWSQTADSPDVPFVQAALTILGFKHGWHKAPPRGGWNGETPGKGKPVAAINVGGSWLEQLAFIGSVRPRRMLRHPRLRQMWEQKQLNSCASETVLSVEPLEPGPMVAHKTSTQTLITEGLLSHNTWKGYHIGAQSLTARGFKAWAPADNILYGVEILAKSLRLNLSKGQSLATAFWNAAKSYNGGSAYADDAAAKAKFWLAAVGDDDMKPTPPPPPPEPDPSEEPMTLSDADIQRIADAVYGKVYSDAGRLQIARGCWTTDDVLPAGGSEKDPVKNPRWKAETYLVKLDPPK